MRARSIMRVNEQRPGKDPGKGKLIKDSGFRNMPANKRALARVSVPKMRENV